MDNPLCPYCGHTLTKTPLRKTKCAACARPIYIKATPDDSRKRLMTEAQAEVADALWSQVYRRNRLEREIVNVCSVIGLDSAQVLREIQSAPSADGAWEAIVSLRAITAENLHQRAFAYGVLARIKAERGDAATFGVLRDEALCRLQLIGIAASKVPSIKVQILPSGGADVPAICRAMEQEPVATVEDELRNPRLPNPACPASYGALDHGFCTCMYSPWSADWKVARPPR